MLPDALDDNSQLRPLVLYSEPKPPEAVCETFSEKPLYLRDNSMTFISTATSLVAPLSDSNSMDAFDVVSCPHCPGKGSFIFLGEDSFLNYMCIKDYPVQLKEAHCIDYTL